MIMIQIQFKCTDVIDKENKGIRIHKNPGVLNAPRLQGACYKSTLTHFSQTWFLGVLSKKPTQTQLPW